jgi:hypothetical protein
MGEKEINAQDVTTLNVNYPTLDITITNVTTLNVNLNTN